MCNDEIVQEGWFDRAFGSGIVRRGWLDKKWNGGIVRKGWLAEILGDGFLRERKRYSFCDRGIIWKKYRCITVRSVYPDTEKL